jgi:hypothetical protein
MAMLFAIVPLDVRLISSGLAFKESAIIFLKLAISFFAVEPVLTKLPGK